MPADQTATDVVQRRMIIITDMGMVQEDMDLSAVSPLDGRLVIGFAQG